MRPSQYLNITGRLAAAAIAKNAHWRAINPEGKFLHCSGEGFVGCIDFAWRGNYKQFKAMNARHGGTLKPKDVDDILPPENNLYE